MDWAGKDVLVVGLGVSGLAVARFLVQQGARVTVNDVREREALGGLCAEAAAAGVTCVLGGHPEELFQRASAIVVSPGVPALQPIKDAIAAGIEVMSEIEVASRHIAAPIIAITGTNGKSTVTTLVGEMCKASGKPTFVGGNLGTPLIDAVGSDAARENGLVVVELSSFQLEHVHRFRAHVALLLNITDDHLDRYDSFDHYAKTKGRIFERQAEDDFAIVPADDPVVSALAPSGPRRLTFGVDHADICVRGGALVDSSTDWSLQTAELRLRGLHNMLNACAAALAARAVGIGHDVIERVLRDFDGLPHRMQFVARVGDVEYIDDSKATNVGAAAAAIDGLAHIDGRIVLIAGGRHKGGSYTPLRDRMDARGRAVVLIGEASPLIAKAFEGASVSSLRADSMEDAVEQSAKHAAPGDVVLLAPACSSFDMFRSYSDRGDRFQEAVHALGGAR